MDGNDWRAGLPHQIPVDAQWMPEEYLKEIVPRPRAIPSAWIRIEDGRPVIRRMDEDDELEWALRGEAMQLTEGAEVLFSWMVTFEPLLLTRHPDGSHTLDGEPSAPRRARPGNLTATLGISSC